MLIDIKYAVLTYIFKMQIALLDSRYLTLGSCLYEAQEDTERFCDERQKTLIKRNQVIHKLRRIECRIY